MDFLVLGAGYTGERVARLLLAGGHRVHVTARDPDRLAARLPGAVVHRLDLDAPADLLAVATAVPPGVRVLHSIPPIEGPGGPREETARIVEAVGDRASRMVYLSSTGVYGPAATVDETTPPMPMTARDRLRVRAEEQIAAGGQSWMVLRPAAIYGPFRGVHAAMRAGRYRLPGEGKNWVSRIHVDDLAAVVVAALLDRSTGAWPVADEEPATAREVAAFCAERLGLPMPPSAPVESLPATMRSSRRVDGRAVLRLLGIRLRYPSYRTGIPAALEGEARETPP